MLNITASTGFYIFLTFPNFLNQVSVFTEIPKNLSKVFSGLNFFTFFLIKKYDFFYLDC